jgi:hypothetical protein
MKSLDRAGRGGCHPFVHPFHPFYDVEQVDALNSVSSGGWG